MNAPRRGACPGLADPMPTGDGLLARLIPFEPIALNAFSALCRASQRYGNGIIEVTQRGSIQVRGLSPVSVKSFADEVATLGLGSEGRPTLLTAPLLGCRERASVDVRGLVAEVREVVRADPALAAINPKISLLIDGDGALHLDEVSADLRLRWEGNRCHLSIAGTAATSVNLGWTDPHRVVATLVQILRSIAGRGSSGRARDLSDPFDIASLRASLADAITEGPPPSSRPRSEPIHTHPLSGDQVAQGVALAFGYAHSTVLERFVEIAARCGAVAIRPAPGRALIAVGIASETLSAFKIAAAAEGLIVEPRDGRRFVVACAGAPACRSAMLSTRELAPALVAAAGSLLDGSMTIHLSGCEKGCAHPARALLTLVGPNRVMVEGRASDPPHGTFSVEPLLKGLERLRASLSPSIQERSSERLSRLGTQVLLQALSEAKVET